MSNRRHQAPPRKMKEVFLIFCEGQTEEAYIDMLRRYFRAPIRIVSSIQGQSVSKHLIDEYKRSMQLSPSDRVSTFLMYDLDVAELLPRLQKCDAELLVSNPTIELWFLLHSADQRAAMLPRTLPMPCSSLHRNGATITKVRSPTDRHAFCKTICLQPSSVPRCSPTLPTRRRASTCSSNDCKRNPTNKPHKHISCYVITSKP